MRAYLLVLEIAPMNVGERYEMLPLHCTLVHWFKINLDPLDFTNQLQTLANHVSPLLLESGDEAIYTGKTKHGTIPVTVNTIKPTAALNKLHLLVCDELDKLDVQYTAPQYVKQGYSPHVTHQGKDKLSAGATHTSMAMYVVEADAPEYGNERYIYSKIEFLRAELLDSIH